MKALLLAQHGDVSGNLMWYREFPTELEAALAQGLHMLTSRGYWASTFPEGDGFCFRKEPEDAAQALTDFRECLTFLEIELAANGEALTAQRDAIAGAEMVLCTCLTPVEGLRLLAPIEEGNTHIHPPIDGDEVTLQSHLWGQTLCDEPGADVTPGWHPYLTQSTGDAKILGYPLIERQLKVPATLLLNAAASVKGQEKLIAYIIEDAESALDLIRLAYCSWRRLEHLPNNAGWIGEFAEVYVEPQTSRFKAQTYGAKPSVLRVVNNWLGLEISDDAKWEMVPYMDFIDGLRADELGLAVKSALRSAGRAFYLVDPEAAFLHLVYAIDGLCEPGKLTGLRHRFWICACVGPVAAAGFKTLYADYDRSYSVRNKLVHGGKTFAGLGEDPVVHLETMMSVLCRIIKQCVILGEATRSEFVDYVVGQLRRADLDQAQTEILNAASNSKIKTLKQGDKEFTKIETARSTN